MGYTMKHKQGHFPFKACPGGPMKQKTKPYIVPKISFTEAKPGEVDDALGKFVNTNINIQAGIKRKGLHIGGLFDYTYKGKKDKEVPHHSRKWADTGLPVMVTESKPKRDMFAGIKGGAGFEREMRRSSNLWGGSIKGTGTRGLKGKSRGKLGFTGRATLGIGYGGVDECVVGDKYCARGATSWNVGAYGEYGSKHSMRPGTRVGISGRYGALQGDIGYDVISKKPSARVGVDISRLMWRR